MNYSTVVYALYHISFLDFVFLENSQKPPNGRWTAARQCICLCVIFWVSSGTAWRHKLDRQAILAVQPNSRFSGWRA